MAVIFGHGDERKNPRHAQRIAFCSLYHSYDQGEAVRVQRPGLILAASSAPQVIVKEPKGQLHFIDLEFIASLQEEPAASSQSSS